MLPKRILPPNLLFFRPNGWQQAQALAVVLAFGWMGAACAPNLFQGPDAQDAQDASFPNSGGTDGGELADVAAVADAAQPSDAGIRSDAGATSALDGGGAGAMTDGDALAAAESGDPPSSDGGVDPRGFDAGDRCELPACDLACANGFASDENACPRCECAAEATTHDGGSCPPVLCDLYCESGFRQDPNGCEICACQEAHCELIRCPDNTHCEIRPADPTAAEVAVCVEDVNPVCDLSCEPGFHCELQQVVCIQAPCPPLDVCVRDADNDEPLPVDCRELRCPPGTQCSTTSSGMLACVPHAGCDAITCRDNMICRMTPSVAGDEIPVCVIDPNATCDLNCDERERCEIISIVCDEEVCPRVDRCIAIDMPLTCADLDCLDSHTCVLRERTGGDVEPFCVPVSDPCALVLCEPGWTCEEAIVDGHAFGRCVREPTPSECDLTCPQDHICQLREAPCADGHCPSVAECVPRSAPFSIPGTCETVRCAAGHRCISGPLQMGLPTSYCASIYADYCEADGDCQNVPCRADDFCLPPPDFAPSAAPMDLCFGLCLGETTFCGGAADCGPHMACDLEACVPSSCQDEVCTSDCRAICVQKDQIDCEEPRYDCGAPAD